MAAEENLTKSENIIAAREVDFVTRFQVIWDEIRDIMGVIRPIQKAPGTILKSKYAEVTLHEGAVEEGDTIPYSQAQVKEKEYEKLDVKKYAKAVSIESITEHGYDAAIQLTDDQFLYELQAEVLDKFYKYIQTGTLEDTRKTFQDALAMAQGKVREKWKKMHRGFSQIVGFCNILDAYEYLGAANITTQSQFGMDYIENFLGYSKLFLTSEIAKGKVVATPSENIALYYVNPSDSAYSRAGLDYRTQGDTPMIGVHVNGNYGNAVSETFAIMGMSLFAEYLDGIAVVTINAGE